MKLDNLLLHYVREHKKGNISDAEYFLKCVKAMKKHGCHIKMTDHKN